MENPREFLMTMKSSQPFGCSVTCINGFQYTSEEAVDKQLAGEEKRAQGNYLVGIILCTVVLTYQDIVIPVLERRGWEPLTIYYSNSVHDYHPIQIWCKKFDRRSASRVASDAKAGISVLIKKGDVK